MAGQGENCFFRMPATKVKTRFFPAGIPLPGSVLFLFAPFDTIICFFQPERFCHRAGRAYAAFLLERAGQRLPHYAEEQALISPHAFVIRRTWFADALPPVFFPEFFPIFCHYILSRPVLPGPINK